MKTLLAVLVGIFVGRLFDRHCHHSSHLPDESWITLVGEEEETIVQVKSGYSETYQLKALDKAGNPTAFAEPAKWESGDESVAKLEPSADGTTCKVHGLKIGSAKVTATGVGAKGKTIIATGQVEVLAGDAVSVELVETGDDSEDPSEETPVQP